MTAHLDPKFGKVVDLMRSTTHEGERNAAKIRAGAIAARSGLTLDRALKLHDAAPVLPSPVRNIFAGFDDWMEEREPGHKARRAAAKTEKERQRLSRVAEIVARYRSEDAALAPCWRERAMHDALGPLRRVCRPPFERWTDRLDGYDHCNFRAVLPKKIIRAIETAYPLPATFRDAKAEHDYWTARRQEIEDVLGPNDCGDDGLDLVARLRAEIVCDLAEKDLPTTALVDLHARFAMYRKRETDDVSIEKALFRDLTMIVESASVSTPAAVVPKRPELSGQIQFALRAEPARSDRNIARALSCSPTTVGQIRRDMGLAGQVRTVQRGGQTYRMATLQASAASEDHGRAESGLARKAAGNRLVPGLISAGGAS